MNKYEIMFIVKSDMEEAEIKNTAETMKKVLTEKGAKLLEENSMGQRELAYEIQKMKTGYYYIYLVEEESENISKYNHM